MPPPTFFMTFSHWDDTGEGRPDLEADIRLPTNAAKSPF
jgi:hypothetical protein